MTYRTPMAFLIEDGYTLDGLIPARPGMHGDVRFKYRPALPQRVVEYLRADKTTAAKELANDLKLLLEQLVSWDVSMDKDGSLMSITEDTLRRSPHPALQVMLNHITGYAATEWGAAEKNS